MDERGGGFALFRDPVFARFFGARSLSMLGDSFAPVALAFAVLQLPDGSPELLSIVLACESVPLVAFLLLGGVVADRLPRGRVLVLSMMLSAASSFALGAQILLGWTPLAALGAAAALNGTGIALFYPALTGLIPEILPVGRLQEGNALLGAARNAAQILGLVAAGGLVAAVGGGWALLLGGTLFVAAALLVTTLPIAAREHATLSAGGVLGDLRDGWREFLAHEWLWVVVAVWSLLVMFLSAATGVIGPVLANAELGGAGPWSWILAGDAIGSLGGGLAAMRWRPQRPMLAAMLLVAAAVPLPFLSLGLGAPLWADVAAMAASGVAFGMFGVVWSTLMQLKIEPAALSRVSSYDALGSLVLQPLGLLLAGPAAVLVGGRTSMLGCGIALFVLCAAPLVSRDVRRVTWRGPVHVESA